MGLRGGHTYRGTLIGRAQRSDSKIARGVVPATVQRVREVLGDPPPHSGRRVTSAEARPESPRDRARRIARLVAGSRRNSLLTTVTRWARAIEDLAWRRQRFARLVAGAEPQARADRCRLERLAAGAAVRVRR